MISQQQIAARVDGHTSLPMDFANAATRYQAFREVEEEHLRHMARHRLQEPWTAEVRAVVVAARHHIHEAGHARTRFRAQVRELVVARREAREPLTVVLRRMRSMLESLTRSGAIRDDGGWFEAEVFEWAIQEYESVA